jgi:hypothetical protein
MSEIDYLSKQDVVESIIHRVPTEPTDETMSSAARRPPIPAELWAELDSLAVAPSSG